MGWWHWKPSEFLQFFSSAITMCAPSCFAPAHQSTTAAPMTTIKHKCFFQRCLPSSNTPPTFENCSILASVADSNSIQRRQALAITSQITCSSDKMVNTFTKVFIPLFVGALLIFFACLVIVPKILAWRRRRAFDHDTELAKVVSNSANIDRFSAAVFPSHPAMARDCQTAPGAARLAHRAHQPNRDLQNPFLDPPGQSTTFTNLPSTPRRRNLASLLTPTRRSRRATVGDDTASLQTAAASSGSDQDQSILRVSDEAVCPPSGSTTIVADDQISVVSLPEPSYRPLTLTIPELAYCPPRVAGRAPPLSRNLDQFPVPRSASAEKESHPNQLLSGVAEGADDRRQSMPPTPPDTVRRETAAATPGARLHVATLRRMFDRPPGPPQIPLPRVPVASSIYSRNTEGEIVELGDDSAPSPPPCFSRPLPRPMPQSAPGGVNWV
jgi:hypothetical protein